MHGAVLLDEAGEVLRPAIIWCDQRTQQQCEEITERVGAARLIELTANPALTGFTLPKLLWVRHYEPEIWKHVRTVLLPKDYVRWRLTGERCIDVADASGTLLFDVQHRKWSHEVARLMDLDERLLPRVFESPEVVAHVSSQGAKATGLREITPVIVGAGDQAAGAVGLGVVRPGAVSATIGTSGVVFAATERPALDPRGRVHTFCHALPGRWHVMGVTQGAGLSLRWFRDHFGAGKPDGRDPYDKLSEEAACAPPGSDGLLWAPYLMGERTPHLDPHARAALVGLTASHTRAHVLRSILEGVAFSLRDTLTIFDEMKVPSCSGTAGGRGGRRLRCCAARGSWLWLLAFGGRRLRLCRARCGTNSARSGKGGINGSSISGVSFRVSGTAQHSLFDCITTRLPWRDLSVYSPASGLILHLKN
jgi:xylulokinase